MLNKKILLMLKAVILFLPPIIVFFNFYDLFLETSLTSYTIFIWVHLKTSDEYLHRNERNSFGSSIYDKLLVSLILGAIATPVLWGIKIYTVLIL